MNFTPITITADNISWALNANVALIEQALATKAQCARSLPLPAIDANGHKILSAASDEDHAACTLGKFQELQNAN